MRLKESLHLSGLVDLLNRAKQNLPRLQFPGEAGVPRRDGVEAQWLHDLTEKQHLWTEEFLQARVATISVASGGQIAIAVEWFNGTVFQMELMPLAQGSIRLNSRLLSQEVTSSGVVCEAGKHCVCPMYIAADPKRLQDLAIWTSEDRLVTLEMQLTWSVRLTQMNESRLLSMSTGLVKVPAKQSAAPSLSLTRTGAEAG